MGSRRPSADLRRAARALALVARPLERAAAELTLAQYRVLALVVAGDERATLVANRLAVAKPTVTAVVDGLVERGYLAREAVDGDRRAQRLVVTDAGRTALATVEVEMARVLDCVLDGVDDREAVLHALLALETGHDEYVRARLAGEVPR
jgi:DNA-binding MarR family transcriptional regulator